MGFKYIYWLEEGGFSIFNGWRKSAITDSNGWNRITVKYLLVAGFMEELIIVINCHWLDEQ